MSVMPWGGVRRLVIRDVPARIVRSRIWPIGSVMQHRIGLEFVVAVTIGRLVLISH